jgi:hypothetical protein
MAQAPSERGPVTGKYKPDDDRGRPFPPEDHHIGWDRALKRALDDLGWPPGDYPTQIEFGALIHVTNPGHVIEYHVTVI